MKLTIEIANGFTIRTRDGAACNVDSASIPDHIWERIVEEGITSKVRDAASGAWAIVKESHPEFADASGKRREDRAELIADKMAPVQDNLMQKTRDALYEGEWTSRGDGTPADPLAAFGAKVIRRWIKAAKSPSAKTHGKNIAAMKLDDGKADSKGRAEYIATLWETVKDDPEHPFVKLALEEKAEADRKKREAAALDVEVDI